MRSILIALLVSVPFNAIACDAVAVFAAKWGVDPATAIIHTTNTNSGYYAYEINVFDLGDKAPSPDDRYAVTWKDEETCTIEAKFGDLPSTFTRMEFEVYERR